MSPIPRPHLQLLKLKLLGGKKANSFLAVLVLAVLVLAELGKQAAMALLIWLKRTLRAPSLDVLPKNED